MAVALLLYVGEGALGQRAAELEYKVSFTGLAPGAGEKHVIEAFHDQDPGILLSLDVALQQAKVRTFVPLDEAVLSDRLAAHGIAVEISVQWTGAPGQVRTSMAPGFPVAVDTGDPAADQAAYEAAKQAWIAAHPALYDALQQRTAP